MLIENMNQTPIDQYGRGKDLFVPWKTPLKTEQACSGKETKKKNNKKRKEKETNIADQTWETETSSYYFLECTLKDALTAKSIMNTLSGTRIFDLCEGTISHNWVEKENLFSNGEYEGNCSVNTRHF